MDPSAGNATEWGSMARHDENETHSRQPYQLATCIVFTVLSIFAVALRIWVRKYMIKSLGVDDSMMVIALFSFIIYNAALMRIVSSGAGGTHVHDFEILKIGLNWTMINEVFYLMTQIFLKLSLGIFFLRILVLKYQRRICQVTIIFSIIINAYHIFFVIFQCGDPRKFAENLVNKRCVSQRVSVGLAYEQASSSVITDLAFATMPIFLLWNVNLNVRAKISAGLIMSLGAFGVICSIVRLFYVEALAFGDDFFWTAVNLSLWSTAELGCGIVAGSLATLRPLLKKIVMTTRQHVTHRTTSSGLKSTTKEPLKKGSPGPEELTSFHSIFHPWELGGSSGSYTTSCIGGETTISADRSRARSIEIWSSADQNNRSNIWPFVEDSGGIAKVVDVEISVSQTPDPESEWKARDLEEGAGFWRMRDEDQIQQPERAMIGISRGNSIAEWERLPDLLPVDEADEKSSLGSRDTGRQSPIPNPLRAHPI